MAAVRGMCCEREKAAIACQMYRKPFVINSEISDMADDAEEMPCMAFEETAAERCAVITGNMIAVLCN